MTMGPIVVININPSATTRTGTRALVRTFQRLTPVKVLERHFLRIDSSKIRKFKPSALVIGPQGVPFDAYSTDNRQHLFQLLRDLSVPTLAVCGGHQALVLAHGGALAPVHGGTARGTYKGLQKETGLREVRPVTANPLLDEPSHFIVSHVEGVSTLPTSFRHLGRGSPCDIQMVQLKGKPVFGVQFHPERGGDGDKLLLRFLNEAKLPAKLNE